MTLLRNVRLVDPDRGAADDRPSDVKIERGRVAQIAPAGALAPAGPEIDGGGRFALPGLVDCHCHLTGVFLPDIPGLLDLRWIPAQIERNQRAQTESGVTTARDLMAPLRIVLRMRETASDPRSGRPRILCSGPMLTVPGGYPAFVPADTLVGRAIIGAIRVDLRSRRDAERWVDRLAEARVDVVKVGFSSRTYVDAGTPLATPSPEIVKAIAGRAHRHGLPVAVHHSWMADLRVLLDLPFDTLEHLTMDESIDEPTADRIAARGLPVTTNLEVFAFLEEAERHLAAVEGGSAPLVPAARRALAGVLRDIRAGRAPNPHFGLNALRGVTEFMRRNLARLASRGVRIGAATDAGTNLVFGSLPDEMRHMVRAGLAPAAAIRAATSEAGRLLGLPDVGRIAPGFRADVVLLDADPIADVSALARPALVMRDGVVQVDRILPEEDRRARAAAA